MATRVLSTQQAKEAIRKFQQIVNGPLVQEINNLNAQGRILSDANVWDGRLAEQFRSEWPNIHATLNKAKDALEELRRDVEKINTNIMTAGGNE